MVEPVLIPLRPAAFRLGLTPERLLRLITSHAIVGQRIGARWFVDVESLRRFQTQPAVAVHIGSAVIAAGVR